MGACRNLGLLEHLVPNDDLFLGVDLGFIVRIGKFSGRNVTLSNNGWVAFVDFATFEADTYDGDIHDDWFFDFTPLDLANIGPPRLPQIPIVTPFFGDVDTRLGSGQVRYGNATVDGAQVWAADWLNVGYFAIQEEPTNRFQLIIYQSDGYHFEANVDRVLWEAGEASGGNPGGLYDESIPIDKFGQSAPASAGIFVPNRPDQTYTVPGSLVARALLDGNIKTALKRQSYHSAVDGRFVYTGEDSSALRLTQRDDGFGVTGHARLNSPGAPNASTSIQSGRAPRIAGPNTYA